MARSRPFTVFSFYDSLLERSLFDERQTDRQTERQTDRQRKTETETQTDRERRERERQALLSQNTHVNMHYTHIVITATINFVTCRSRSPNLLSHANSGVIN